VALSLTFVNQVGAPEGMNQAAPGSFIPESFVRWSQDVLYDRVGQLRRRAPYTTLPLYNVDGTALLQPEIAGQRVIGVVNTRNPDNENVIGIVVTDGSTSRVLFYNAEYRKAYYHEVLDVRQDTIVFSRPALSGGVFIGFLENYGETAGGTNKNFLYYWRGAAGDEDQTVNGCSIGVTNNTPISGSAVISNNKITVASHGLPNGYPIAFTNLGSITGLSTGITYYVVNAGANDFQVATAPGGTNISFAGSDSTVLFITAGHTTYTNTITNTPGSFDTSKLSKGMFVYRVDGANEYYLGVLDSWATNGSSITLEKDCIRTYGYGQIAHFNTSANIKFVNMRPYIHNHGRGLITKTAHGLTVTSGTIGSEGEGHFAAANITGWALYRASDGEWLGDVESVTNNAALVLDNEFHTNIISMNADEYVARPYETISQTNDAETYTGIFNTTYAGYQWYGNAGGSNTQNRIVFSAYHDPESVDLSKDAADSILIPGTQQMRGIATSSSGLLVFLEDKTYLIRGNYRANFSLEELYPEGCLSAQSIVEYGGGVFWASKNGILFYDGATVRNLTEANLGAYYTDSIKTFDATNRRIYGFFYKDYLFMTFSGFASNYTPLRYEPIYAENINNTPAIADFQADDWDPDFTPDDFLVENNVPIYWNSYRMYTSAGASDQNTSGLWSSGTSYPGAVVVTGNTTITGLTGLGAGDVGKTVIGYGIPANTTIVSQSGTSMVISNAPTESSDPTSAPPSSVQILPAASTGNTWGKSIQFVWGPVNFIEAMTFAIYLPTNAITAISNFDFRGFIKLDSAGGTKGYAGINAVDPEILVTKKSLTSNVATLTVPNHSIPNGSVINVSGVDATFDGEYTVTSVTATTISYAKTASNVTEITSGGTVTLEGTYGRLVDVDSMLNPINNHNITLDSELSENLGKQTALYYKGPDFYLQTKHYPVGDPVLKKWFRQVMLNLYLLDGGIRMDIVDMEDNDRIDVEKKRHVNWELFEEAAYSWNEFEDIILPKLLAPNRSTWQNVETLNQSWYDITDSEFTRRKKKISWRYPSAGFRLYQMNKYRPANYQSEKRPHTVIVDSWNIGFKPMRASRV